MSCRVYIMIWRTFVKNIQFHSFHFLSPASSFWTRCLPKAWLSDSPKKSCCLSWKSSAGLTSALTGEIRHQSKGFTKLFLQGECDLARHYVLYVCVCRVRLRKKTWKNPGTVFLDYHVYEEDISISSNWEVFLEVLNGIVCFCVFSV